MIDNQKDNWLRETLKMCRQIFDARIEKLFGIKPEDRRLSATIVACIAMYLPFFLLTAVGLPVGKVVTTAIDNVIAPSESILAQSQPASVVKGSSIKQTHNNTASSTPCVFELGQWDKWWGSKIQTDPEDSTFLALPNKSEGVLFAYHGEELDIADCTFSFAPAGEAAINYVISLDDVYQLTIGDNDYSTVSLRAHDAIGEPAYYVKETRTNITRPRVLGKVKKGSEITVRVIQGRQDESIYNVRAIVTYIDANELNTPPREEEFSWQFQASPTLKLPALQLSIGLIPSETEQGQIAVYFIEPNPLVGLLNN